MTNLDVLVVDKSNNPVLGVVVVVEKQGTLFAYGKEQFQSTTGNDGIAHFSFTAWQENIQVWITGLDTAKQTVVVDYLGNAQPSKITMVQTLNIGDKLGGAGKAVGGVFKAFGNWTFWIIIIVALVLIFYFVMKGSVNVKSIVKGDI